MKRQVIRLTEGDLHRIIRESVKRILREENEMPSYTQEDLDMATKKMQALKKKGDPGWIQAAQERQRIKEFLGQANVVNQPDANWSREENERLGNYTYDQWKQCDPRKRSGIKQKPKQADIDAGRRSIADTAIKDAARNRQNDVDAMLGA